MPPNNHDNAIEPTSDQADLTSFGLDDANDSWIDHVRAVEIPGPLGCIGPYEIVHEAGRGGQGIVYQATRPGIEGKIAVKRLIGGSFASSDARNRLQRELELAAKLSHPNIVTVLGIEIADGQPLLAMEWIDGLPIAEWAVAQSKKKPSIRKIVNVFIKVCNAVHYAHSKGIMHRDLKPSNILVNDHNEPYVMDFGLAKQIDHLESVKVSHTGQFLGTHAYASPEQIELRSDKIDIRTDVYSLGIVLFEALTGKLPYPTDESLAKTLDTIRYTPPTRPTSIRSSIDRDLETVILKSLEKSPDQRYASVEAFSADLIRYLNRQPVLAHPPGMFYSFRKLFQRHRIAVSLGVVSIVLLITAAVGMTWLARETMIANEKQEHALHVAQISSSFLQQALSSADPRHRGGDVTVVQILDESAQRVENELANEPEAAAEIYSTIARTYYNLWLTKRSEPHWRSALRLYRAAHGNVHPDVADCLSRLGAVLSFQDRPEAIRLQREALNINTQLYGEKHTRTIQSLHGLAFAIYRTSQPPDYKTAGEYFQKILVINRERYGAHDINLVGTLHTYAAMLSHEGRHEESMMRFEEALNIMEKNFSEQHPRYIECQADYALCLKRAGHYEKAEDQLRMVVVSARNLFGQVWTANPLNQLAGVKFAAGQFAQAEQLGRDALTAYIRGLQGTVHHVNIEIHDSITDYLAAAETFPTPTDCVEVVRRLQDLPLEQHLSASLFTSILQQSTLVYEQMNALDTAKFFAQEVVRLRTMDNGPDHWRTAEANVTLGGVLATERKYDQARPLLLQGYKTLVQTRGKHAPETQAALIRLIALFEKTGDEPMAQQYRNLLDHIDKTIN